MSLSKREKIEKWLLKNQAFFNNQAIEREIGASKGSIQKFLKYNRKINDERIDAIGKLIKKMNSSI